MTTSQDTWQALSDVQPGDRLLITGAHQPDNIVIVDKVTAQWAVTRKGTRYRRDTGRLVGAGTWDLISAQIATEEDVRRVHAERRQRLALNALRNLIEKDAKRLRALPVEKLEQALEILRDGGDAT